MNHRSISALFAALLVMSAVAAAAEAGRSRLAVTSVGFVGGLECESGAPVGVGRPTYKAPEGGKLVEVLAELFLPAGNEWDLTQITLATKGGKTLPLVGLSYCTNLDGKARYSLYHLSGSGAAVSLDEGGKLSPVQGWEARPNKVAAVGWKEGHTVHLKLAFVVPSGDVPAALRHGDQEAACVDTGEQLLQERLRAHNAAKKGFDEATLELAAIEKAVASIGQRSPTPTRGIRDESTIAVAVRMPNGRQVAIGPTNKAAVLADARARYSRAKGLLDANPAPSPRKESPEGEDAPKTRNSGKDVEGTGALTQQEATPPAETRSVAGSRWTMVRAGPDRSKEILCFGQGGEYSYAKDGVLREGDGWKQEGDTVRFSTNNHYAEFEGVLDGKGRMAGTGRNAKSTWRWTATRMQIGNAVKASPPSPQGGGTESEDLDIPAARGTKPALQRNPLGANPAPAMCELSEQESAKYPADKSLARTALTGNLFDSKTGAVLCTDVDIQRLRKAAGALDLTRSGDRDRLVQEFVRIFGQEKGRRIGLRIHDGEGHVKYVWPGP